MKNIRLAYLVLLTGLALLSLFADRVLGRPYEFFAFQLSMINLTGILAIGCMSAGMFLAIRPTSAEPFLGGLDKSYRLHKWLGISALVLSTLHWLWVKAPNWLIGLGWMQMPARKLDLPSGETLPAIAHIMSHYRGLAASVGEWAFYVAVPLIIVALLKRFPYRHFFKTHRLLAVAYLALAFHSVILMKPAYWNTAIVPLMGLLIFTATLAAAVSLLRRVGYTRRAVGAIDNFTHHRDNRAMEIVIKLKDRWFGHAAGQFAFLTLDAGESPHPFTISCAWHDDGKLRCHIKGIGDYMQSLPETVKPGDLVTVEGPYGAFDFRGEKPRQIWIAGDIGITPFLARLQARMRHPDERTVDLFYSTKAPDQVFIGAVEQLATHANVRLHILVSGKDERLTAMRVCEIVPEWMSADVWFCGPAGFGRALRRDLVARGLAVEYFHQELFEMRWFAGLFTEVGQINDIRSDQDTRPACKYVSTTVTDRCRTERAKKWRFILERTKRSDLRLYGTCGIPRAAKPCRSRLVTLKPPVRTPQTKSSMVRILNGCETIATCRRAVGVDFDRDVQFWPQSVKESVTESTATAGP